MPLYRTFTYRADSPLAELAQIGRRVLVPFGNRRVTGYVLGPGRWHDPGETKRVLDVLDSQPLFPPEMIAFFRWVADYYVYPIGNVIRQALPAGLVVGDIMVFSITGTGRAALASGCATAVEALVLDQLQQQPCSLAMLTRRIDGCVPHGLVYAMARRHWIQGQLRLKRGKPAGRQQTWVKLTEHAQARLECADAIKLSAKQRAIVDALRQDQPQPVAELKTVAATAGAMARRLASDGWVELFERRVFQDPFGDPIAPDTPPRLTDDQQQVADAIYARIGKGFYPFLLAGVTGSGKTEVYMQAAAAVLAQHNHVLVLVPEIALISQMERRFRARFGECIAVLHSGLTAAERHGQWMRIAQGEARIAIGARSAIFAPFDRLGLIVVDEEHDASYKQDGKLHYHARDLALVRARQLGAVALLGSATPSVQSGFNCRNHKLHELNLRQRVAQRPMPTVEVIDLRQAPLARGVYHVFTPRLRQTMRQTLARGEQVLLFVNRRGFASYALCRACGQPLTCSRCDVSLTLHRKRNAFRCHYCGFTLSAATCCRHCGSDRIRPLGYGTESVAEAVAALFPDARVARMDADTTRKKGALLRMLTGLRRHEIDVLIGTQMVAKGHDFHRITLVGILCADQTLDFPDFRAGERTFQLLAQVAGRAGRGDLPGQVILQTYNPDHFTIQAAIAQDVDRFFTQEIGFRQCLGYPPFMRLALLKIDGKAAAAVSELANQIGQTCRQICASGAPAVEVMGPIEAPLARLNDRHRWQLFLKSDRSSALHQVLRHLIDTQEWMFRQRGVRVIIDVDPVFMM